MQTIRILGIAPYEGMRAPLERLAAEFPQIELSIYVGDLQEGVELAQKNFHADYDVIISRGGTAQMLSEQAALPVIEIPITAQDILRALRLAENITELHNIAVVGFPNITESAAQLRDLLQVQLEIHTIHTPEEALRVLQALQMRHCQVVLCDMIANTTARQMGLNTVLIASGSESIRSALMRALQLCENLERLQEENRFLRTVLSGQSEKTVVFNEKNALYFTSSSEIGGNILDILRAEVPNTVLGEPRRLMKSINGLLYSIKAARITSGNHEFVVFCFTYGKAPLNSAHCGVRFFSSREIESSFSDSFFGITGAVSDLQSEMEQLNKIGSPVMLCGEDGTGKEPAAQLLYMRSKLRNHPFVSIDCQLINEKTWDFLLNHHNSPLCQSNLTLYVRNIDSLERDHFRQLTAAFLDMEICVRNRVIFSCVVPTDSKITESGAQLAEQLCCVKIFIPPLRRRADLIQTYINSYLSQLNAAMAKEILGLEPAALQRLKDFAWPHNFTQFERVLTGLVSLCDGSFITDTMVEQALALEDAAIPVGRMGYSLNLTRPLHLIEQDIILAVLNECDGNQSAAAKRLGISRSTLWRICKNN